MHITKTRAALLLAASFAAGAVIDHGGSDFARQFGVAAAAAQSVSQTQTAAALALFNKALDRVMALYVEPVSPRTLVDNALKGMLSGLDPHSAFMTEPQWHDMQIETAGHFGGIGLQVTDNDGALEVISPIDGTPAAQAGLKAGDLITAIDDKSVEGLTLDDAVSQLRGPPGSTVRLTIKREGQSAPLLFALTRQMIEVKSVTDRLVGDIGVIRISEFTEQTDPGVRAAVRELRAKAKGRLAGLVLDLRNDPGGLLDQAIAVANDFLDRGTIVSTRGRRADDNQSWSAEPGLNISGHLPLVVLINNGTASAAEIVAGALQDNDRAMVVGTRSFGKGSVQTIIPLDDSGALRLTTARYYTPSGRSIQGVGISPDVEVAATRDPQPHFGPQHEADLLHILSNQGGIASPPPHPALLPAAAQQIPRLPPPGWPALDPAKPATDFQLQQAMVLVHALTPEERAAAR